MPATTSSPATTIRGVKDLSVMLPCQNDDGKPLSEDQPSGFRVLEWRRIGVGTIYSKISSNSHGSTAQEYEGRIVLKKNNSLLLTDIKESDAGQYACQLKFFNPPQQMNGQPVELSVNTLPFFTIRPPRKLFKVKEDPLTLNCAAGGRPIPKIVWNKCKKRISNSSRILVTTNRLYISRLQQGDDGVYQCVARNSVGVQDAETELLFASKPKFVVRPKNDTAMQDKSFTWPCQAIAQPDIKWYKWYYEGKEIIYASSLGVRSHVEPNGTMIINVVSKDDSGKFTCEASNGYGSSNASAYLDVQYPPKVLPSTQAIQTLPRGLAGTLQCNFEAHPPIQEVVWTKSRRVITFEPSADSKSSRLHLSNKGQILKIDGVESSDKDIYTCQAFSKAGKSSLFEIHAIVEDPPKITKRPAPEYIRREGQSVNLECGGIGQPKPTISWKRTDGEPVRGNVVTTKDDENRLEFSYLQAADHGEYQCILSNKVAELDVRTQLTIEDTFPQAPKNVSILTGPFSADVRWAPGYNGGHGQSFVIKYRNRDLKGEWISRNATAAENRLLLSRLRPDTNYEFSIEPWNIRGFGFHSPPQLAKTKGYGSIGNALPTDSSGATYYPSVEKSTDKFAPSAPRQLAVTQSSGHDITLSWEKPKHLPDSVKFYTVEIKDNIAHNPSMGHDSEDRPVKFLASQGCDSRSSNFVTLRDGFHCLKQLDGPKRSVTLVPESLGLIPGSEYDFRVRARSVIALSEPSNVVRYQVPGVSSETAVIAGVIGGLIFLLICILLGLCAIRLAKRRRRKAKKRATANNHKYENGQYAHMLDELEYPSSARQGGVKLTANVPSSAANSDSVRINSLTQIPLDKKLALLFQLDSSAVPDGGKPSSQPNGIGPINSENRQPNGHLNCSSPGLRRCKSFEHRRALTRAIAKQELESRASLSARSAARRAAHMRLCSGRPLNSILELLEQFDRTADCPAPNTSNTDDRTQLSRNGITFAEGYATEATSEPLASGIDNPVKLERTDSTHLRHAASRPTNSVIVPRSNASVVPVNSDPANRNRIHVKPMVNGQPGGELAEPFGSPYYSKEHLSGIARRLSQVAQQPNTFNKSGDIPKGPLGLDDSGAKLETPEYTSTPSPLPQHETSLTSACLDNCGKAIRGRGSSSSGVSSQDELGTGRLDSSDSPMSVGALLDAVDPARYLAQFRPGRMGPSPPPKPPRSYICAVKESELL